MLIGMSFVQKYVSFLELGLIYPSIAVPVAILAQGSNGVVATVGAAFAA